MKIVCVMVASVDGKTTHGNDPTVVHWSSPEDQQFFQNEIKAHNLIVMGRKTYEAAKPQLTDTEPRLRVIMTAHPKDYQSEAKPHILEFTNEDPKALIDRLGRQGYTEMLLAGGAGTNAAFFKENLVDELSLTIEPKLFGIGNPLAGTIGHDVSLTLLECQQFNPQGTLHLLYRIVK